MSRSNREDVGVNMMPCKEMTRNLALMEALRLEEQFAGQPLRGTGRRSGAVTKGRRRFAKRAMLDGYTRAEIARALEIDWTSVDYLLRRREIV